MYDPTDGERKCVLYDTCIFEVARPRLPFDRFFDALVPFKQPYVEKARVLQKCG